MKEVYRSKEKSEGPDANPVIPRNAREASEPQRVAKRGTGSERAGGMA